MGNQPFEPATGAFKREFLRPVEAPRTISRETANKLFIGMMRDQARFGGLGVLRAVANVHGPIAAAVRGMSPFDQESVDRRLLELDGTLQTVLLVCQGGTQLLKGQLLG